MRNINLSNFSNFSPFFHFLQVAFSDESSFECSSVRPRRVWTASSSKTPLEPRLKHPVKVMMWGIMSAEGAGRLHVCEGSMNQHSYLHVLESRVRPQMEQWSSAGVNIFMHDSAPCHKARLCTNYLNQINLDVLKWTGNSPDLNPLETHWGILKQRLCEYDLPTEQTLIAKIVQL